MNLSQTKGERLSLSSTAPTTAQVHPANSAEYSVFCGDTFRFIITDEKAGSEKTTFNLHSALVARLSVPLKNLIEGNMREAKEGFTILSDVDANTFLRFCEFVYTGNYNGVLPTEEDVLDPVETDIAIYDKSTAAATVKDDDQEWEVQIAAADPEPSEYPWSGKKNKKATEKKVKATLPFLSQLQIFNPLVAIPFSFAGSLHGITDKNPSKKNYTPVLLCHAQVYALAEKYDVLSLKQLALWKLHHVLCNLPKHHGRHLTPLIEYVYNTTPERTGGVIEPMRNLVAHYAASEVERMMKSKAFLGVLEAGGDFVKDLMEKVVLRL